MLRFSIHGGFAPFFLGRPRGSDKALFSNKSLNSPPQARGKGSEQIWASPVPDTRLI
jgi:hypothetical protein